MKKVILLILVLGISFAMNIKVVDGPIKGIFVFPGEEKMQLEKKDFLELRKHGGEFTISKEKGLEKGGGVKLKIEKKKNKKPIKKEKVFTKSELLNYYLWD